MFLVHLVFETLEDFIDHWIAHLVRVPYRGMVLILYDETYVDLCFDILGIVDWELSIKIIIGHKDGLVGADLCHIVEHKVFHSPLIVVVCTNDSGK